MTTKDPAAIKKQVESHQEMADLLLTAAEYHIGIARRLMLDLPHPDKAPGETCERRPDPRTP